MTVPAAPTVDKLERRLTRERARVRALEAMIEDRTRSLFLAKEQLHETTRFLESVLSSMSAAVLIVWWIRHHRDRPRRRPRSDELIDLTEP